MPMAATAVSGRTETCSGTAHEQSIVGGKSRANGRACAWGAAERRGGQRVSLCRDRGKLRHRVADGAWVVRDSGIVLDTPVRPPIIEQPIGVEIGQSER